MKLLLEAVFYRRFEEQGGNLGTGDGVQGDFHHVVFSVLRILRDGLCIGMFHGINTYIWVGDGVFGFALGLQRIEISFVGSPGDVS